MFLDSAAVKRTYMLWFQPDLTGAMSDCSVRVCDRNADFCRAANTVYSSDIYEFQNPKFSGNISGSSDKNLVCLSSAKCAYPAPLALSDYFATFVLQDNYCPALPLHRSACGQSGEWTVLMRQADRKYLLIVII